jgi:S1-C subfamily serine protease
MTIDEYETGGVRQLDPDGHADQPRQLRRPLVDMTGKVVGINTAAAGRT